MGPHLLLGALALAGCGRWGFEDNHVANSGDDGNGTGDVVMIDALECNPVSPGDFPNWPMPTSAAGAHHISHTVSADATMVTDDVTGLVWQRTSPANMVHSAAKAYCESLMLGGQCDWRLPERIELISITDYEQYDPAIDRVAFPGTASNVFWSATPRGTNSAWYVQFQTGLTGITTKDQAYGVRCVRHSAHPPATHYDTTAAVVVDNGTGLAWQRILDAGSYNHNTAMTYCAALGTEGGGWRSPTINELGTLVDVTAGTPAIQLLAFPNTPASLFWSKNLHAEDASQGWPVNFDDGTIARSVGVNLPVRCVR